MESESSPTTIRILNDLESSLQYGVYHMQGRRPTMEDRHLVDFVRTTLTGPQTAIFAIFDGHGGTNAAEYCEQNFTEILLRQENFIDDLPAALTQACRELDREICQKQIQEKKSDGTTMCMVLVREDTVYCCNVGDSRSVMCRAKKALELSFDHTPDRPNELERIKQAGGQVVNGRINNRLNVARTLGDVDMKDLKHKSFPDHSFTGELVIPDPEITINRLTPDDNFIIVACDGIWANVSNQAAVNITFKHLHKTNDPELTAKKLVTATFEAGSTDNISAIVISLLPITDPDRLTNQNNSGKGSTRGNLFKSLTTSVRAGNRFRNISSQEAQSFSARGGNLTNSQENLFKSPPTAPDKTSSIKGGIQLLSLRRNSASVQTGDNERSSSQPKLSPMRKK